MRMKLAQRKKLLKQYKDAAGYTYTNFNWKTQEMPRCTECAQMQGDPSKLPCCFCCALNGDKRRCYYIAR